MKIAGKIKLVAIDMDGTLLLDDHQTVTKRSIETLKKAIAMGVVILPSTGRTLAMLPEQVRQIQEVQYVLSSNGAAVTDLYENSEVYTNWIPAEDVRRISEIAEPYGVFCQIYCHGTIYVEERKLSKAKDIPFAPGFLAEVIRKQKAVVSFEDILRQNPGGIEKYNFPYLNSMMRDAFFEKFSAMGRVSISSALKGNMELNTIGCNKGVTLAEFGKRLGIAREEIMAIGDSGNDLDMLGFAGLAVAMENGTAEAKAAAHYITSSNAEDGVAKALEEFVLYS